MKVSSKKKVDRRFAIVGAVKRELKEAGVNLNAAAFTELAMAVDVKKYYDVEVIVDPDRAAERLTLANYEFEHSWAGSRGRKQAVEVIAGKLTPGEDMHYQYSRNGEMEADTRRHKIPEFDVNRQFVALIHERSWDNMEGGIYHDDETDTIVVYCGPRARIDELEYKTARFDAMKALILSE